MIVIMQSDASEEQLAATTARLEELGYRVYRSTGDQHTVLGAVGTPGRPPDPRQVQILPGVREVHRVTRPYRLVSRAANPGGTVVDVAGVRIGGDELVIIAGPCAVESRDGVLEAARAVRAAGAHILRGGAFKPRTSPYSFQGLGEEGLRYLQEAARSQGMPCVTEVVDAQDVELVAAHADMLQVGARNMQNFRLLEALGRSSKPVLLKRGHAADLEELLLAAEYVVAAGNPRVVLCERGVRTFLRTTRNTLDLSAIPVLRELTHLPVLVDPSHSTGLRAYVPPMARAAIAAGADGIIVEVHPEPDRALSDGAQSLTPEGFGALVAEARIIAPAVRKRLAGARRALPRRLARPLFERAVVVGVGLIGGSVAAALREAGAVGRVIGVELERNLAQAQASGVVDELRAAGELERAVTGADLVILATPVNAIAGAVAALGPKLSSGALLTDVGSTKRTICEAARGLGAGVHFVGGHPMAGSEHAGAAHADPLLFTDAVWALCPVGNVPAELLARLRAAVEAVGAVPLEIEPERHDRLAAAVSHVPRLLAAALANSVGRLGEADPLAERLTAGGFRDLTRTASSPYAMWRDILATNRQAIKEQLAAFRVALDGVEAALASEQALEAELTEAARHREAIPRNVPGLDRPGCDVTVRLLDEPGALAAMATVLAHQRLNICDVQMLKVRLDEDNTVRLTLADAAQAQRAMDALRAAGYVARRRGA